MRIMSFNVNGIRARMALLPQFLQQFQPDILGIQETKVSDEEFPVEALQGTGYHLCYHGQKGHYGVAFLSKKEPISVQPGFPFRQSEDEQRRIIAAVFEDKNGKPIHVINGYFPQGESRAHPVKFPEKQRFYEDINRFLTEHFRPEDHVVVLGDMNVAPVDADIGIGEAAAKRWLKTGKTSFLPEEREWLNRLYSWGLYDSYRQQNPSVTDRYSWFDYRSRGFEREPRRGLRIDLILATRSLMDRLRETGIDYTFRGMERPSDHCAIWADFDL